MSRQCISFYHVYRVHVIMSKTKHSNLASTNSSDVRFSVSAKFLGLNLDEDLKWNSHITSLVKKLNSSIFALRSLSGFSSEGTLKLAYHGLFESSLRYGIEFWGFCSLTNFNRLFVLQKRALRIVWGLGPTDSCRERFRQDGILTLPCLLMYHSLIFVFKNQHLFQTNEHSYLTRNRNQIVPDKFRSNAIKNSIFFFGPKFLNSLPANVKNITILAIFKKRVMRYLVENAFYSIKEASDILYLQ